MSSKNYIKKTKLSFSPKNIKRNNIQTKIKKYHKNKEEINYDINLTHKKIYKNNKFNFQNYLFSLDKNESFPDKFRIYESEDYKNNTNIYNTNQKCNIIGGKNFYAMPKMLLNKSKSVYELKTQNQQNFIKNRSNYVINITRSLSLNKKILIGKLD